MGNIAAELANLVDTEPEHISGPNGGSWWVGPGLMGSAAMLAGRHGTVIAVVDELSQRYGPVTGASTVLQVQGPKPLDQLRRSLAEVDLKDVDDAAVVAVGGEQLMRLAAVACESVGAPVVLCPTGSNGVANAVELGSAIAPGHTIVLELATLQSGDPRYVEPLDELWSDVSSQLRSASEG